MRTENHRHTHWRSQWLSQRLKNSSHPTPSSSSGHLILFIVTSPSISQIPSIWIQFGAKLLISHLSVLVEFNYLGLILCARVFVLVFINLPSAWESHLQLITALYYYKTDLKNNF